MPMMCYMMCWGRNQSGQRGYGYWLGFFILLPMTETQCSSCICGGWSATVTVYLPLVAVPIIILVAKSCQEFLLHLFLWYSTMAAFIFMVMSCC
jgi:hypothetical protein